MTTQFGAAAPQPAINVRSRGATGLGIADDTAAIQRAIYDAADSGVGTYVPPGTYLVSALYLPDNSHLFGASWSSILKSIPNANPPGLPAHMIQPKNAILAPNSGIRINDLKLLGNSANQWGGSWPTNPTSHPEYMRHGIALHYSSYCTIERVWAEDFDGDGIYIGRHASSASTSGSFHNLVSNCVVTQNIRNGMMIAEGCYNIIRNCRFVANQVGMNPASPKYATSIYQSAELDIEPNYSGFGASYNIVEGCAFMNGWNVGIQITRPSVTELYNVIRGNLFVDNRVAQVQALGPSHRGTTIEDNTFICTTPSLIGQHIRVTYAADTRIARNRFLGGCSGVGSAHPVQIDDAGTTRPQRTVLTDNLFDFTGGSGDGASVRLTNCDDTLIAGNTYVNATLEQSGCTGTVRSAVEETGIPAG